MTPPKVYTILPGRLWLRGRTNDIGIEAKRALATELGFRWVVALCPRADPEWQDAGVAYRHWPMADGKLVPKWMDGRGVALAEEISEGRPGLVYCNAGRNRSALMAGVIMQCLGEENVVKRIQTIRPNALANPAFVQYLEGL